MRLDLRFKMGIPTMRRCTTPAFSSAGLIVLALCGSGCIIKPPGPSYRGPLSDLTSAQLGIRDSLRRDVQAVAAIGPRATMRLQSIPDGYEFVRDPGKVHEAGEWVARRAGQSGATVTRHEYDVAGTTCANLEVELPGRSHPKEIVVVSAHYDTVPGSPGANDDGSGVAALFWLIESLQSAHCDRTIRFLFFVNEELPHAYTEEMGSRVYAKACRQRGDNIVAMLSLDPIGYYSREKGSQKYPWPLNWYYPSTGDFLGVVSNRANAGLMKRVVASFRRHARFPSEGVAMNVSDVERSDHGSFWLNGYPAVLVTDTGEFRDPNYHAASDTPDKVDYDALARVVEGLRGVILDLASVNEKD